MIAIREAVRSDIPKIARVHVDVWRSTYSGILADNILARLSYKKREQAWHQVFNNAPNVGGFTLLAENELAQVIGFADGGRERTGNETYKGELNAIYILEAYQHKGFGHTLVERVAQRLVHMKIYSMLTWVLEANPACGFYESLGGQIVLRKQIEIGHQRLSEIAYGWTNISELSM